MTIRAEQLQREVEADALAAADRLQTLQEAVSKGDLNTRRARAFMARAFQGVKDALKAELDVKHKGLRGKYKAWIRRVPLDVAAAIALRECIAACSATRARGDLACTMQTLTRRLGRMYETEVRIREAEAVNPMYMQQVMQRLEDHKTTDVRRIRTVVNSAYTKIMRGELDTYLTEAEAVQVGRIALQAVMDAGVVTSYHTRGSKGIMVIFELVPEVYEFITGVGDRDVQTVYASNNSAMICEPEPWDELSGGGYLSIRRKVAAPLMRTDKIRKSMREQVRREFTSENMPTVFQAGNYLQSVAYHIHEATTAAVLRLWHQGGGVMGVPTKNPATAPEWPLAEDYVPSEGTPEQQAVHSAWKRQMAAHYDVLREWRGRVLEISGTIRSMQNAAGGDIWFPIFFDSRGRWYYRGSPNPQGTDLAKAILHFGEKKPLGKRGLFWLRVHIANCYGFDKGRMAARAAWTEEHWAEISAALDEPENHADVFGTDSPWCMFSAAWELREALRCADPASYCTGIPVHQDASCSGLQHFSALLRDPVGARYVNLEDAGGDEKQDIYAAVASAALASCERDLHSSDEAVVRMAKHWLRAGIPRGLAKKPVMTYLYGATLRGTVTYLENFCQEEFPEGLPEGIQPSYFYYLGKKLFLGIEEAVPAAAAFMVWLQGVVKRVPKGVRMQWTTPTGFRVQHDYQEFREQRVRVRSCGVNQIIVREFTEGTRLFAMKNAITPNFVHALDASHMTMVAVACNQQGLALSAIHDSFGTHPSDVDRLRDIVRTKFVGLYEGHSIIANFLKENNLDVPLPTIGSFNLSSVLESEFIVS